MFLRLRIDLSGRMTSPAREELVTNPYSFLLYLKTILAMGV